MVELGHDQRPDGWSGGAEGYADSFARFTGLYADRALALLELSRGERLLDVAAGTGALSLRAARAGADVLATDFAPGMVALLREAFAEEGLPGRVEQMDGQALAVEDGSFDAAASMFGLIFFPDIPAGLRELHRALRPGGRVAIGAWDRERFGLFAAVGAGMRAGLPENPPPGSTPVPLRLADAGSLVSELEDAGFAEVAVEPVTEHWRFEDPRAFFLRMPDWSPPVQQQFAQLPPERLARAADGFAQAVEELGDGQGLPVTALLARAVR